MVRFICIHCEDLHVVAFFFLPFSQTFRSTFCNKKMKCTNENKKIRAVVDFLAVFNRIVESFRVLSFAVGGNADVKNEMLSKTKR